MICEYNLFNFHFDKLCQTDINFLNGCFSLLNKNQNCIIAVGDEEDESHIIKEILSTEIEPSNINPSEEKSDDKDNSSINMQEYDTNLNPILGNLNQNRRKIDKFISRIGEDLTSICSFRSKKLDVGSYATGSINGYMSLYPSYRI